MYPLNRCQIFALVAHIIKFNDVWNRLKFKFNWKWWQQVTLDNIFNHSLFSVYCEHANGSEQCGHANDAEIGRNYDEEEFWLPNYKETADKKWEKKCEMTNKLTKFSLLKKNKKIGRKQKMHEKNTFQKIKSKFLKSELKKRK